MVIWVMTFRLNNRLRDIDQGVWEAVDSDFGIQHAAYAIAYDFLLSRAQTLDKEKIRDAIGKTDRESIRGLVECNEKHYSPTPLVTGQWVKGEKWPWELKIVDNKDFPAIPKTADLICPLPKS